MRITGSELAVSDPECKTFFDSLKLVELKDRPAAAKAPDDDLRPLARDGNFPNLAAVGVHTTGIAFCLGRKAAFRTTYAYTPDWDESSGRLKRYRYPTFQPDGEYKLPRISYLVGSDGPRNRLYLHIGRGADTPARLARFDVPEQLGAGKQEEIKGLKTMDIIGSIYQLRVAPDGRHLFALRVGLDKQPEVVRIEAETMTSVGAIALDKESVSLCLSPDGKTLFAGADAGLWQVPQGYGAVSDERKCLIQEIDVAGWKVRRTFTGRGQASALVCGADGRLYQPGSWCWIRTDPTAAGAPPVSQIATNKGALYNSFILSPDGKRLYATIRGSHPYSLDAKELFDFGRRVIAPESMKSPEAQMFGRPNPLKVGTREDYSADGVISADGKCLFLSSGHVFWLAGAGPLPEVDAAAKWKP